MDDSTQMAILSELRIIKKLLAQNLITGKKQIEQISRLDSIGFKPKEIAEILNTTGNTVRVALNKIRKGKTNRTQEVKNDS